MAAFHGKMLSNVGLFLSRRTIGPVYGSTLPDALRSEIASMRQ
jgi:hypothetical protein